MLSKERVGAMNTCRFSPRTSEDSHESLADGYRKIANDRDAEKEAEEWIEALIADAAGDEGYGLQPVH